MIIEYFIIILLGLFGGTIAGLTPGVGVSVIMALSGFFLHRFNAIELILYYTSVLSASQYIGSMTAIIFGVPGESSSMPAVKEGVPLRKQGRGSEAIAATAVGSFVGSFVGVGIFIMLIPVITVLWKIWNNDIQVIVFGVAIFITMWVSNNKKYISFLFVVLGFSLGAIGFNAVTNIDFLTFGITEFYQGLPLLPTLMGLYAIPELYKASKSPINVKTIPVEKINFLSNIFLSFKKIRVMITSSAIGFLCGLVPSLTTQLASNLTYSLEKKREQNKKRYTEGNLNCLVAAETSNNSASFSSLLPMLILGIPITASEAILYEWFVLKQSAGLEWLLLQKETLLIGYLIINLLCVIIAWPASRIFLSLVLLPKKLIQLLILSLVLFPIVYLGYNYDKLELYLLTLLFTGIIGWIFRKYDTMPLIFAFIICDIFFEKFFRFFVIHFG